MSDLTDKSHNSSQCHSLSGVALVTLSVLMWSSVGIFVRHLQMDVWSMVAWRSFFATLTLAVVLLFWRNSKWFPQKIRLGWREIITAIVMSLSMFCYIAALKVTTVAGVMTIYATTPFITLGLGWVFLRERLTAMAAFCSLASLAGVFVMTGSSSSRGDMAGYLLAFLMALGFAGSIVLAKKWPDMNLPGVTSVACLICMIICFIKSPADAPIPDLSDMLWLFAFSMATQSLSYLLYLGGSRFIPATLAGLIGQLDLLLAPLWVWIVFDETPPSSTLLGGAVTFTAVITYLATAAVRARRV
ncbi:hypothetical protein B1H58_19330 [Pantoea alhagi]|uniref:EamA domain-containing protein n=1 Tax=Pantoea alhagi TaxID=1891675 RepID=A0A1W6BA77_9GAMM|nr:DMT family transporter [Pantoea alhagi]ARJ43988.1 hypothetical protein B1H58_19330 [Pantoea alhagi]